MIRQLDMFRTFQILSFTRCINGITLIMILYVQQKSSLWRQKKLHFWSSLIDTLLLKVLFLSECCVSTLCDFTFYSTIYLFHTRYGEICFLWRGSYIIKLFVTVLFSRIVKKFVYDSKDVSKNTKLYIVIIRIDLWRMFL